MATGDGGVASAPSGGGYFDKKGEINELRQLLRQTLMEKNDEKRREAIKKVIAYMTLGIDVSKLFSDVVMASHTQDLVQKKMIYLYLTNYAETNGDLTLLAINTLQKDCRDQDPTIRGLALRSLCGLRLPDMLEYIEPAATNGLRDANGYVRKAAIVGVLKIFHISPTTVRENDEILDRLYALVGDPDGHVSMNALFALEEILADLGGVTTNKLLITHLLNRIGSFSEWGQCAVLKILAKYDVATEEEMFDVMNVLEGLLKQSSPSVVLSVANIFLQLTARATVELQLQVIARLKGPLLTLIATNSHEIGFAVLSHIHVILAKFVFLEAPEGQLQLPAPSRAVEQLLPSWVEDYKHFFVKWNEPTYIKKLKLDILTLLVFEKNAEPVIAEIREAVTDVSGEISKHAIHCLSRIALLNEALAAQIVQTLLELLKLDTGDGYGGAVVTETAIVMKDILRKYPEQFDEVGSTLETVIESVSGVDGKAAIVWMLGEFGARIREGPYLLEPLIEDYDEQAPEVKSELLISTTKLFFHRPRECQKMLGKLLEKALNDEQRVDLRDRALLYYRLLLANVEEAKRVICGSKARIRSYREDMRDAVDSKIFREFNTLSVIYNKPSAKFCPVVGENFLYRGRHVPSGPNVPRAASAGAGTSDGVGVPPAGGAAAAATADLLPGLGGTAATRPESSNLLDVDLLTGANVDLLSPGGTAAFSPAPRGRPGALDTTFSTAPAPGGAPFVFLAARGEAYPSEAVDGAAFQERWEGWPTLIEDAKPFQPPSNLGTLEQLLQTELEKANLQCLASGFLEEESMLKFYFFGVGEVSGETNSGTTGDLLMEVGDTSSARTVFLFELLLKGAEGAATCTVKAGSQGGVGATTARTVVDSMWSSVRAFL